MLPTFQGLQHVLERGERPPLAGGGDWGVLCRRRQQVGQQLLPGLGGVEARKVCDQQGDLQVRGGGQGRKRQHRRWVKWGAQVDHKPAAGAGAARLWKQAAAGDSSWPDSSTSVQCSPG